MKTKVRIVQLNQAKQSPVMGPQGPQIMIGPREGSEINREIAEHEKDGYEIVPNQPTQMTQFNPSILLFYKQEES